MASLLMFEEIVFPWKSFLMTFARANRAKIKYGTVHKMNFLFISS
jgi:hypothetical protein